MSNEKKNHIRKKKVGKKPKSKYQEKVKVNASFEEMLKMAAEGDKKE